MKMSDTIGNLPSSFGRFAAVAIVIQTNDPLIITYDQLYDGIVSTGVWMRREFPPGSVVMLDAESPLDHIVLEYAALDSGLTALSVPPMMLDTNKKRIANNISSTYTLRKCVTERVKLTDTFPELGGDLLHFTSGSTGAQKLAVRPVDNLIQEAYSVADRLCLDETPRAVLVTTPLAHSYADGIARAVLSSGSTLVVVQSQGTIYSRAAAIRNVLDSISIDVMTGVPYIYQVLLRGWRKAVLPSSETAYYAGGEPLRARLSWEWSRIANRTIQQEYGLSESGIVSFADRYDSPESIGSHIPGVIMDQDSDGELLVFRPFAPSSYYRGEYPDTFVTASVSGMTYNGVRTGDLGICKDGRWYLQGRKKSVIIVAGMKVIPTEIENELLQMPEVEDAVVVGVDDRTTGQRTAAFVRLRGDEEVTVHDVARFLRGRLESYKIPKIVRMVDEDFPRTESGKLDRKAVESWL